MCDCFGGFLAQLPLGVHYSMRMLQPAGMLSGRYQGRLYTTKANSTGLVASTSGRSPDGKTHHVRARRILRCVASSAFAEISAEEAVEDAPPASEAQQDDGADSNQLAERESRSEEATAELLNREVSRRRNFAIISHPDAGKTTLVCMRRAQKGGLSCANHHAHMDKSSEWPCVHGSLINHACHVAP